MRLLLPLLLPPSCTPRHPASRPPAADTGEAAPRDTGRPVAPCPGDMALVDDPSAGRFCIDRDEAPNRGGALPLVMLTFDEAVSWCEARARRLCYDDEWEATCRGQAGTDWPYGDEHRPGVCNDDRTWIAYDQSALDAWPWGMDELSQVQDLEELLELATEHGGAAAVAEVRALYQGEPSGSNQGCVNEHGVFDLTGNVEEWTRRRDGGADGFHGGLEGRYWAEARSCGSEVTTHGDGFRFYEIGLRCCADPTGGGG